MPCFVYILGSDGKGGRRTCVGWTTDLEGRLNEHNTGTGACSAKGPQMVSPMRRTSCQSLRSDESGVAHEKGSAVPSERAPGIMVSPGVRTLEPTHEALLETLAMPLGSHSRDRQFLVKNISAAPKICSQSGVAPSILSSTWPPRLCFGMRYHGGFFLPFDLEGKWPEPTPNRPFPSTSN